MFTIKKFCLRTNKSLINKLPIEIISSTNVRNMTITYADYLIFFWDIIIFSQSNFVRFLKRIKKNSIIFDTIYLSPLSTFTH